MSNQRFHIIATTAFGLESLVKDEIKQLGYDITQTENGRVHFLGDVSAVCRANLWLRCADRVLIEMGSFEATTFDSLYEQTKALSWDRLIPKDGCFPAAKISSVKSMLFSKSDGQRIVKKAVVDSLACRYGIDVFPESGARFPIHIRILKDKVSLCVDTSGSGLHKRGYREHAGAAPLKETMAAAMVKLSRWRSDRPFLDPFCGSGTIVIEAAMIGKNIAPGLGRSFVSETWSDDWKKQYDFLRTEARDAGNDQSFRLLGSDIDGKVLKQARTNAVLAGVENNVAFQKLPVQNISSKKRFGVIVSNPPYGERLGDETEMKTLYADMGRVFSKMPDWSYFILCGYPEFERYFGKKATKNRKLYNSMIKTYFYQYFGPLPRHREDGN